MTITITNSEFTVEFDGEPSDQKRLRHLHNARTLLDSAIHKLTANMEKQAKEQGKQIDLLEMIKEVTDDTGQAPSVD